jgi:hypothetical protein
MRSMGNGNTTVLILCLPKERRAEEAGHYGITGRSLEHITARVNLGRSAHRSSCPRAAAAVRWRERRFLLGAYSLAAKGEPDVPP